MKQFPTLADVATKAGVSKMTASRALRSGKNVSQKNIDHVREIARSLGYVGNPIATSLSSQKADLIGVVVPSMSNIIFPEVLSGVASQIEGVGVQSVFGVSDYNPQREHEIIRSMLSWRPCGMIITGIDQPDETKLLLKNAGIPIVQIMDTDGDAIDLCVGVSQYKAGADMAEALIRIGRRQFGYIGNLHERDTRAQKRFKGFHETLQKGDLDFVKIKSSAAPSSMRLGRALSDEMLSQKNDLDCIYYSNDDMAAGGLFSCMSKGIKVPDDILIAGFNGLDFVHALPVQIATSITPRRVIGERAAQFILQSLHPTLHKESPGSGHTVSFDLDVFLGQAN